MTKRQPKARLDENILSTIKKQKPETVDQLVEMIFRQDNSLTKRKIVDRILKLHSEGKITLKEVLTPTPRRITEYLRTPGAYWYWTTIAFIATTVTVVFTIPEGVHPLAYPRYFLGAIFVLWLPGYSLIKALFPVDIPVKTSAKSLDYVERISLNVGMSLALVTLIGLFLNQTPWGIQLPTIVISLLTCTVLLATAAIIREHQAKASENHKQFTKAQKT